MPLFTVSSDKTHIAVVQARTFSELNILEEKHFQEMFRTYEQLEDVFGEPLFVLDNEYNTWKNGAKREIDLLALDGDANLVVIELKRTSDGGHMELQALRYAAMVSRMTFSQAVSTHQAYLRKHKQSEQTIENAESRIREFLDRVEGEVTISDAPRVILVSQGFSTEIITTVLWLIERGLRMECYSAEPYSVESQTLLNIERILPLPTTDVEMPGDSPDVNNVVKAKSSRPNAVPFLESYGYLKVNDTVRLIANLRPNFPRETLPVSEQSARYTGKGKFEWEGQNYSISMLCKVICEHHDLDVENVPFAGPSYWAKDGDTLSLNARMKEILSQSNAAGGS